VRRSNKIRAAAGVSTAVVALVALPACGGSAANTTASVPAGPGQNGSRPGDPSTMLTQRLDALVTAGTITNAQEQAVVSALKAAMADAFSGRQGAQGAPSPGATQPAQGSAPSPGATPPSQGGAAPGGATGAGGPGGRQLFSSALAKLVSAGTITTAQSQAIIEALTPGDGAPAASASPTAQSI
jgi:hypothetical protein